MTTRSGGLTQAAVEAFLFRESDLLDDRLYEDWLDLFTTDGIYWIPLDDQEDPTLFPSIAYEDAGLRSQRVYQLLHESRFSQTPPSRTMHAITNVRLVEAGESGEGEGEVVVRCNQTVHELRPGLTRQRGLGEQRALAARCEYRLRHEKQQWRIAQKKVLLLNRDQPIENLTFIL